MSNQTIDKIITDATILDCGHLPSKHETFTTGYGFDRNKKTYCYDCCAKHEAQAMRDTKQAVLYLVNNDKEVTDWPGHLRFNVTYKSSGKHNFGIKRIDLWFNFNGYVWHGVHYGDNSDLVYCKQTKQQVKISEVK